MADQRVAPRERSFTSFMIVWPEADDVLAMLVTVPVYGLIPKEGLIREAGGRA